MTAADERLPLLDGLRRRDAVHHRHLDGTELGKKLTPDVDGDRVAGGDDKTMQRETPDDHVDRNDAHHPGDGVRQRVRRRRATSGRTAATKRTRTVSGGSRFSSSSSAVVDLRRVVDRPTLHHRRVSDRDDEGRQEVRRSAVLVEDESVADGEEVQFGRGDGVEQAGPVRAAGRHVDGDQPTQAEPGGGDGEVVGEETPYEEELGVVLAVAVHEEADPTHRRAAARRRDAGNLSKPPPSS